jgi:hypothetical protein
MGVDFEVQVADAEKSLDLSVAMEQDGSVTVDGVLNAGGRTWEFRATAVELTAPSRREVAARTIRTLAQRQQEWAAVATLFGLDRPRRRP